MESLPAIQERQIVNVEDFAMSASNIQRQVNIIQETMKQVMHEGEHYGKIPGCGNKPSLLKPGAEKLSLTFRLAPDFKITRTDMKDGHREYEVITTLTHIPSGMVVAQGVGSCSTMEGKYRYRVGEGNMTDIAVPKEYWDNRNPKILKDLANKAGIPGDKFGTKKNESGKWFITTHGEKAEHDNPADYYNTVLKMAKKRSHVDAILTATAASDIFTQDIEDMPEVIKGAVIPPTPAPTPPVEPLKQEKKEVKKDAKKETPGQRLQRIAAEHQCFDIEFHELGIWYRSGDRMTLDEMTKLADNFAAELAEFRKQSSVGPEMSEQAA